MHISQNNYLRIKLRKNFLEKLSYTSCVYFTAPKIIRIFYNLSLMKIKFTIYLGGRVRLILGMSIRPIFSHNDTVFVSSLLEIIYLSDILDLEMTYGNR